MMADFQPQARASGRALFSEDWRLRDRAMNQQPGSHGYSVGSSSRLTILVVDNEAYVFELLSSTFSEDYNVLQANEGMAALALAVSCMPNLILLDVMLPGIDAFEICGRFKSMQETSHIPLILLTRAADDEAETRALQMGATDFISKPINSAALKARVANQMNLRRAQDQLLQAASQRYLDDIDTEIERLAAKDRARTLEMQMKDKFLTHVSHELRAPLTAIYLFVSLMADRLAGTTTPQQDEYLLRTLDNVEQMKSMVDDLLDTASIRNGKVHLSLHPVSIAKAVDYATSTLKKSATKKEIRIAAKIDGSLSRVYADPARVRQILVILLENAIRFTPHQGEVVIAASSSGDDSTFLLVEISDTGCGIEPEACEDIFEKLYQADSSDQGRMGLGLGLHIAKELVTVQGGRIWVDSAPGKGSTFRFTLPVFHGQPETPSLVDEFDV